MALFQPSVLKKYVADLPKLEVEAAFQRLTAHFGNPDIQENIRNAKEEQYQEGFLRELFVTVLGFTLHPQPHFNLITEQKNEKNSKKADGAILRQDKVIAVIELKSLKTTDLQSIELQAFGYKNNQAHCIYVVTSNFQKLRFYIENAIDFEEFDLFNLSKERFEILYLCLNYNNLLSDLPLRLKKASLQQEENITKKLYKDYSNFKQALFADVSARNRQHDKLLLYKKTQKLLDRFLFLFFAEDKGLLPPNTVQIILNQWEELKELDEYVPLYQRFQRFFGYLNVGHKSKHFEIFAYNGGLFAPDVVLDSLVVTDNLLYNHSRILSHYDFDTEVDTNILGHIFEHSLNELDEITALTEGGSFDKTKTKRKKDGIFYTPRYITKYIVAQTLGELCRRKQHEIGLNPNEISRATSKKVRDTEFKKINTYREWLLGIAILDPACGSGAFLNEALSFLIDEHRLIDAMIATLFGDAMTLTDNVIQILENNIFGVDINEESVEIARLSLWLRTAKIGRKLNDLSKNIKVGNSLISDPSVAGDLAFEWQREFPQVFLKGGFDIVIGNPPYVRQELLINTEKEWLIKNYQVGNGTADLYTYFYENSLNLLVQNGKLGFITPNKFIKAGYGKNLRQYLSNFQIKQIIDFGELPVFADAATFPTIILINKSFSEENTVFTKVQSLDFTSLFQLVQNIGFELSPNNFKSENWQLVNDAKNAIFEKMKNKGIVLKDYIEGNIFYGIKTGFNEAFVIDKATKEKLILEDAKSAEIIKPFLIGDNIRFYKVDFEEKYLIFTRRGIDIEKYPAIKKHLEKYQNRLTPGVVGGRKVGTYKWYEIQDSVDYFMEFEKPKIIYPDISKARRMYLDTEGYYLGNTAYFIPLGDFYLLSLLNSRLIFFYYKNNSSVLGDADKGGRMRWFKQDVEKLPIAIATDAQKNILSNKADEMLRLNSAYQKIQNDFIKLLQVSFSGLKLTKKLENWHELTFSDLRKELEKQQLTIPLKERLEWQTEFERQKTTLLALRTQITATDTAIDRLVYTLYDLTQEEIALVEGV